MLLLSNPNFHSACISSAALSSVLSRSTKKKTDNLLNIFPLIFLTLLTTYGGSFTVDIVFSQPINWVYDHTILIHCSILLLFILSPTIVNIYRKTHLVILCKIVATFCAFDSLIWASSIAKKLNLSFGSSILVSYFAANGAGIYTQLYYFLKNYKSSSSFALFDVISLSSNLFTCVYYSLDSEFLSFSRQTLQISFVVCNCIGLISSFLPLNSRQKKDE
ncbi:hypothetical protein RCL1_000799 [Eukaryota sp. TZLM3-RCL]